MIFIFFLLTWTAMNVYVFWRLTTVPGLNPIVPIWVFALIGGFLWSSYLLARVVESRFGGGLPAAVLEFVGAHWIGIVFLLLVCLLFTDLVTGFGWLLPQAARSLRAAAVLLAVGLSVFAMVQARRAPEVTDYEVRLAGLPAEHDGKVLVVMSDMHLGTMIGKDWAEDRIDQAKALNPDMIVLAGDIFEGSEESVRDWVPVLRELSAPLGVWAVSGNHEYYAGVRHTLKLLSESGVRVLRDEWAEAAPGLLVAGVDDLTVRRRQSQDGAKFVDRALQGRPANAATIYLSHTPWHATDAAERGANLMLSGHTHNGQIWPFTYAVRRVHPLTYGRYDVNGMTAIVCRGTGTWGPRMRLWQRGEMLRITLRAG